MSSSTIMRQRLYVRGIVQGVGFRPFIYGLAMRYDLRGWVRNDSDGVTIEVEGSEMALQHFLHAIHHQPPPLARIDTISSDMLPAQGETSFQILHSQQSSQRNTLIAADTATCADCLHELFDPQDRRYRYPFINCTNCGPRFTIVSDVPYDRANTSMHVFPLCAACQAEYDDPLNRRFHAQPNACPVCGPQLFFHMQSLDERQPLLGSDVDEEEISATGNAIEAAVQALITGAILAIKGLGGYHLACDASNTDAVTRLRQRKQREAKPFALMVADLEQARRLCQLSEQEASLLSSQRRPVVLVARRKDVDFPAAIAPGLDDYGLMLPYTPLHHLLLETFRQQKGDTQPVALIMTSGNLSDEPIASDDQDAFRRLVSIADGFLYHNRVILTRCDDSVLRCITEHGQNDHRQQMIRRSRGYAPEPLILARAAPVPLLAYGAHLKNTFCLVREHMAVLSHHIGDLENLETLGSFREGIQHLERLFDIRPEVIAYDLHPGYLATQEALASPIANKIGVQHHHAHIASVLAEHNLHEPVIGIAADGTGYGSDGSIWGGEILLADQASFTRLGHLSTVALPGGERAVRQPWRVAASYLHQIYGADMLHLQLPFTQSLNMTEWHILENMIMRHINSPLSSSLGRLFDAVAALIGLRNEALYEGQAAIELEVIAERVAASYPISISATQPFQIKVQPIIQAIVADLQQGASQSSIAGRFHSTICDAFVAASKRVRQQHGLRKVALSGGVFQNRLLLEKLMAALTKADFEVYINRQVPPNDGGISFGQAAVACAVVIGSRQ